MGRRPGGVLAMIAAYFDGSGDPSDTPVVSLAGLVSTAEKWVAFSNQWEECLEAFGVSALHMREFAHSEGEFSSWRKDEPRRRRFLNGLIYAIESHIEYSVASSVSMRDYRAIDAKYRLSEFMKPYTFLASTCASAIIPWTTQTQRALGDIVYIFEKGDADQEDVRRCWDSQFPSYGISPIFRNKKDRQPGSEVSAPIRPLEAADLVAYENFKVNSTLEKHDEDIFFDELRRPLQRLFQLPGAKDWQRAGLDVLAELCSRWKVPERD